MTEDEWLACDDLEAMISWLGGNADRKLRLFAVACCRQIGGWIAKPASQKGITAAERYADGLATAQQLRAANRKAHSAAFDMMTSGARLTEAGWAAAHCAAPTLDAELVARFVKQTVAGTRDPTPQHEHLLRHIIGNPFRPHPPLSHVPMTIRELAEAVYQQEQSAIGPLHDALLDAGLIDLADHFKDAAGWHPKGCWVVDLVRSVD
jgi:hypothetical protein